MKVYFVRHGESVFNAQNLHQHGTVELSDAGLEQAKVVADRFKTIPIEAILSSPYTRAHQTALAIQDITDKPLEIIEELKEVKRPTEIEGKVRHSEEVNNIINTLIENKHDPDYHYSDEENFFDLKDRAEKVIKILESRPEENIAVVSHSVIIRLIIALLMFGDSVDHDMLELFQQFFKTKNTGITMLEYKDDKWGLVTWNDHAHLG